MITTNESIALKDDDGYPLFIMEFTRIEDHEVEFVVKEINGWDQDKTPNEVEQYLFGAIKFDGCSHVCFGDHPKGYIHLCGPLYWKRHCMMMEWVYREATKRIKDMCPSDLWDPVNTMKGESL